MRLYRFHFLDAAGLVVDRHSVQLPSDAAALTLGHRMLADRNQVCALEIWLLNRLVHHENRPKTTAVG